MKNFTSIMNKCFVVATFISTSSLLYRVFTNKENLYEIFIVVMVFAFMSLLTSKYAQNE